MTKSDYDGDAAAWAIEQAEFLRHRADNQLDWDHLAEEIEDLAGRYQDEVYSRLKLICQHLLKWQFQPQRQSNSWRNTIRVQRRDLARRLRKNPSLNSYAKSELAEAFADGREDAEAETGLTNLPKTCPWSIEQVLDQSFMG